MKRRKPEKPDALEFYTQCILRLYRDVAATCAVSASSQSKDLETLRLRASSEGMSFLTKTLPSLGKCLDKALASDVPLPGGHSFELQKNGLYPKFLRGFWELIFDETGLVKAPVKVEVPDLLGEEGTYHDWKRKTEELYANTELQINAVRAVRQICYLLYKLVGAHSRESEEEVIREFVNTDRSLPGRGEEVSLSPQASRAIDNARSLVAWVLCGLDLHDIIPGHGPGAVASGEKPWEKMKFSRYYEKLDEVYPYSDYFFYSYTHLCDHLEDLEGLTTLPHGTAKVCLVPKDSRGPRLISMEPLELQWIQQGQMRALVNCLETHPATAGFVNFTDQNINRALAQLHSCAHSSYMVTVDMKEASDRVSCWLVDKLFPDHIKTCLYASRSDETMLPTGELLRLKKFAPMGSSVCFPVEALTFWALAVGSVVDIRSVRDLDHLPNVYVYGDDIVISKDHFDIIQPVFEELHLKFNKDKCCTGRFFRESCGMDAFRSECVTPLRLKAAVGDSSPSATLSYISYVNSCRERGYMELANFLQNYVEKRSGKVPVTNEAGRYAYAFVREDWSDAEVVTYLTNTFKTRENRDLQRLEVRIPFPQSLTISRGVPDWSELLRLKRLDSFQDPFGLTPRQPAPCRHDVPHRLKVRWAWRDIHSLTSRKSFSSD